MAFLGLYGLTAPLATTLTLGTVVSCIGIGFQRGIHRRISSRPVGPDGGARSERIRFECMLARPLTLD
jgi:hypothetical protein